MPSEELSREGAWSSSHFKQLMLATVFMASMGVSHGRAYLCSLMQVTGLASGTEMAITELLGTLHF